jgi:WD40 repeat protein
VIRLSVRGGTVRGTIAVTIKRLDFRASSASNEAIILAAGQERKLDLRIDRSAGYVGPLTITVPGPVVQPTQVDVPANAETATMALVAGPGLTPGKHPIRIAVSGPDGTPSHDIAVTIRVSPLVEVRSFPGHEGNVTSVAISADGRLALSGGADGTVRLWDVATSEAKWTVRAHENSAGTRSVAISPDGVRAVSGGADGAVHVFEVATGKDTLCEKHHQDPVWLVHFDDPRTARSISANRTVGWSASAGKPRQIPARKDLILGQRYKPDIGPGESLNADTHVPVGVSDYAVSGLGTAVVSLFKGLATPKVPRQIFAHTPDLTVPAKWATVSADGGRLLVVGEDNSLSLWDVSGPGAATHVGRPIAGFPWSMDFDVTAAALDSDGHQVLLGGPNGLLKLSRVLQ